MTTQSPLPTPTTRHAALDDEGLPASLILSTLRAFRRGDFEAALPLGYTGIAGEIAQELNDVIALNRRLTLELGRMSLVVGKEGKLAQRATLGTAGGSWNACIEAVNALISDLVQPTTEVGRVIGAVASGDLSQMMTLEIEGRPLRGEFLRTAKVVNGMVEQLGTFASEVTRVAREVGTEGKLGGQAKVKGVAGTWKDLTDNVNLMAGNLTVQVRSIAEVTTAVAIGDLSKKITVDVKGEILELKNTINTMVDRLNSFASEVTRVAREVGTEGKLGGQAQVPGVSGTWEDLTDSVNFMASNLTAQVRNIAEVTTAVATGDLSKKITVDVRGEILELKNTINTMVDQLNSFASEVTRVAREVGTEGQLGGQAQVPGVSGTWKDLTDSVNSMASNLTGQVRNIAEVTTAVATGDLSKKITVDVRGEILALKNTINTMVDQLNAFASEVTRVAREVGTEGRLGGQAYVKGVAGTWKDLTDSVNFMASNLTDQVRNIADVTTAVARGDLSRKITVDVKGEILELKNTINTMVDQLNAFASEVTRVAREVGTEGKLGGQAQVPGVAGTWKDLTDNVNSMATNLTNQVRGIAKVVTAVARGDLTRKLALEARGEIAELADTINSMTDTLAIFAEQVITVAREVGVEGQLGGQAKVPGAAGTWRGLTDNVNQLAANLTTQVRAIGDVATAVTKGDLTRTITVEASGEVAALKDNINEMIRNLKQTTQKTTEQDWLKTNLARFSRMMQGQRDLETVAQQILSELAPLVSAQHGVFYITDGEEERDTRLKLLASYGASGDVQQRFRLREGLVGQCAYEKRKILLTELPMGHVRIRSGLGESSPRSLVVLPVLFEGQVNAVIELASFDRFSDIHQVFLDQLTESIGIVVNTIAASMRTEGLLQQSQSLTQELQSQQEELRQTNERLERQAATLRESEERLKLKQEELQQTNEQLEEKAKLLEIKNREIEYAKGEIEEKAEQLALTSKYKSEFLANMSHELRTPLNSLLILSKMLSDNAEGNLTVKQVGFAHTIHGSGTDLLALINDILDLSKIESGTITVDPSEVLLSDLRAYVEQNFRHVAQQRGLEFSVELQAGLPPAIVTDSKRLQQVLKNLLSNAFKFTEHGSVTMEVRVAGYGWSRDHETLNHADAVIAFSVTDTGIGIPEEKQRIIFEAFQQADGTTSRRYGGTGLGLSISREIARLLGGEIRVVSLRGTGSTFTFYLPRRYVSSSQPGLGRARESARLTAVSERFGSDRPPAERYFGERITPVEVESAFDVGLQTTPTTPMQASDDREAIEPGDRVILIVEDDPHFASIVLDAAHQKGYKVVIASDGGSGVALAQKLVPAGIVLDLRLPDVEGWTVLDRLKHDVSTRHVPIAIFSADEHEHRALRLGAATFVQKPTTLEAVQQTLDQLGRFSEGAPRRLLIIEDDAREREVMSELIGGDGLEITAVGTAREALAALESDSYECVVLDLGLSDVPGLTLLNTIKGKASFKKLPFIVYTGRELSQREQTELQRLAETIIVKDVRSPERLLFETSLHMHRDSARLSEQQRQVLADIDRDGLKLNGAKILVVDDDVRNIFAMTSALESHGATVIYAENGHDGLALLDKNPDVRAVLMDIMMPEMDGYEVMRRIREQPNHRALPVIAVTAKAMRTDREKCIQAGASDYIAKPVDVEHLLSLLRVWVAR
jgi:CheY-like chemotaxis protein/HAMP domain-containing protein/signal transduction histidine kinase